MSIVAGFGSLAGADLTNLTPLDYADLDSFLIAEAGVTAPGDVVSDWQGQAPGDATLTVPSGHVGPDFEASAQNGLPGISFEDTGGGLLRRKLSSNADVYDNFFFGAGVKSIAFAARWDRAADTLGFGTRSTIASKGFPHNRGWALQVEENGTIRYEHYLNDGSRFRIAANAFYSVGDLVLGYLNFNGTNTNNAASFRLYNGTDFVTAGTITTGSSSTKQSDVARDFVIGNILNDDQTSDNAPFEGPIFGVWLTKPANNSIDEAYLARWIP